MSESWADLGTTASPTPAPGGDWSDLGAPKAAPRAPSSESWSDLGKVSPQVSAASGPGFGDLITHPIDTLSRLADYAGSRLQASAGKGIVGLPASLAGDAYERYVAGQAGVNPTMALDLKRQAERENAPAAPQGALETAAGFAGDVAPSLLNPLMYLGAPAGVGLKIAGKPIVSSVVNHALGNAAVMGVVDPALQGGNILRQQQDAFDPGEMGTSMLFGGALGGGMRAGGALSQAIRETGGALDKAIPAWKSPWKVDTAAPAPQVAAPPPLTSVDDLWARLVHQESGGNQGAVSPKGATGVAQLMPDTARQVAEHIGRPDLAEAAMQNTPEGAMANQYLGKIYLGQQMARFDDPAVALAAYNAGPGRAAEWLDRFGSPDVIGRGKWIDMIPFKETRDYVRKILGEHAPAEGDLLPHEAEASAQAMRSHYQDGGYLPPSEAPKTAVDEAISTPEAPPENPAEAQAAAAGEVQADLEKQAAAANSEIPAEKSGVPPKSDFPGDWPESQAAPAEPAAPEPTEAPQLDLTDQALNQMRSGKPMRLGEGPSLVDALIEKGGVRNQGGELSNILDGGDRRWKMLGRQNTGMTLEEAARWAQEHGYIGERIPEALDQTREPVRYATSQDLIDALERERAGEKVYPADRINHEGRMLQDHISDLEPFMHELGVDPSTHTNAEIRAAMDRYFKEAGEHTSFLDEADRANAEGAKAAEMERAIRDHEAGRGHEPMDAGGLWDETRRGEQNIFDEHGDGFDVFGMKGSAAREPSAAARRVVDRDAIYASTKGALRAERKAGAVAAQAGPLPAVEATFADIWRALKEALDVPVRQGRLGMRGALGTYSRKSGVVRVAGVHDVGVEVHELAHALEFTKKYPTLLAEMAKNAKLLKTFDYDQKALRRHEGFAEWMRWYVTNPTYARAVAPSFYDAFEKAIGTDAPKVLTALQAAQRQYGAFLEHPSLASAAASVVRGRQPGLIKSFLNVATSKNVDGGVGSAVQMLWKTAADETYRGLIDHLHPWKQAVQALLDTSERNGVHIHLLAADDPYKLLRQVPAVYAAGHMDLIHGVHPYHSLEPDSPALAAALELALGKHYDMAPGGLADQFDAYLISRRVRHDWDRIGQEGGLKQPPDQYSKAYHEQIVADAEARNPQWAEAAQMVHDWNNELWTKRYEAGFLTEDDYTHGIENNPDYVPLYRDMSDTSSAPGGAHGMSTKSAGGARQRKGSTRAYMSPVQSMMQNAYELNALIARNDALRALDTLAQTIGPDAGRIAERLPATTMKAMRVGVEEVLDSAAREIGVSKADQIMVKQTVGAMFGEDASGKVFRAQDMHEKGEPILYVWDKGKRIPLRLPDGKWGQNMLEAFAGMSHPMGGLLYQFAAMPARILRGSTVLHPGFFLSNTVRDQFTASLLTDLGYIGGIDQIRGIKHELTQDDMSRHYNVVGGEIGGMQSAAERDARLKADMRVLHSQGVQIRHFASFAGLARAVELSETGTRLGLFDRGVDKFSKEGMEPWKAAKEAAFESRDYMDFDRHGGWPGVRVMMRLIPFANAAIQAVDKVTRVASGVGARNNVASALFGRPPATRVEQAAFDNALKMWIGASAMAVASLAWRAANQHNDVYNSTADYVRNTAWVVPISDGTYIAIPKPYELGSLSNAMERAFEATAMHDPTAWGRLGSGLATQLLPNLDPTALEVPFELAGNRDSFGAPIVQDNLTKVDPQFQYTDRTSSFGKFVGEATAGLKAGNIDFRQSPAKVDFLVKSVLSSYGRDALAATNAIGKAPIAMSPADIPVLSRFLKDWTRGTPATKAFYDLVSGNSGEWSAGVASVQKLVNDGDSAKAAHYIEQMDPQKKAYTILQTVVGGEAKDIHPMERAQKLSSAIQGLAFNIQQGDPVALTSTGAQVDKLTPEARRQAVDALHRMAASEQRNALIVTDARGWSAAEPLPYDKYAAQLRAADPLLPQILSERIALSDPHLMPAAQSYSLWKDIGPKLAQIPEAQLKEVLELKSNEGMAGLRRALEKPVPVK